MDEKNAHSTNKKMTPDLLLKYFKTSISELV